MKFVVFDIETTGLDVLNDRIIEIGAIKVEDDVVIGEFEELINPGFSIPFEITRINGIDDSLLENADYPPNVFNRFYQFIKDVDFVIGHNAKKFDYPFLESEFKRNGIKFDGVPCKDTIWLAYGAKIKSKGYSLRALCDYFGVVNQTAHRALSDVYATYAIYQHLKR